MAPGQLVFRDVESVKDITSSPDVYRGSFAFRVPGFTKKTLSDVVDPGDHNRKRRILAPGFNATALADQEPYLVMPMADKLISKISETKGQAFDVSIYMACVTTDIIGVLTYGARFGMLDELENHPFLHVIPNVLRMSALLMCILSDKFGFGFTFITREYLVCQNSYRRYLFWHSQYARTLGAIDMAIQPELSAKSRYAGRRSH